MQNAYESSKQCINHIHSKISILLNKYDTNDEVNIKINKYRQYAHNTILDQFEKLISILELNSSNSINNININLPKIDKCINCCLETESKSMNTNSDEEPQKIISSPSKNTIPFNLSKPLKRI